ncbi:MAG: TIGR03545 family protein [Nitrospirae bacterium]|nr:TIGR03545 family protein [Nitrospirota bacterium]
MKWIRWWGLGVFLFLALAMTALWVLVVDSIVKQKIEEEGTAAVGAKVELDHADLTLFPTGLSLTRLQVTNPNEPMTNAVEIAKLSMGLDGLLLLRRKVIIDEMIITGVKFGTVRTTSGAIDDRSRQPSPDSDDSGDGFQLPPFEVPDVNKILQEEDLETLKLIEAIQTDIQREKELWRTRLKDLPGKAQFAKYQARIKGLKSSTKGGLGGILRGVEEAKSIKQDIERDLEKLKGARTEFEEKIALVKKRIAQARVAPKNDIQRLKEKYSLSPEGLANLGQTLLGQQVGAQLKEAVGYYEMVKPYLEGGTGGLPQEPDEQTPERGKGIDIRFTEFQPLPDFLIRVAKVSFNLDIGEITGTINNITPDQVTLGSPLTFAFSGEQLKDLESMALNGTINHIQPSRPTSQASFSARQYRVQPITLSEQPDWPVVLQEGLADVQVEANLQGEDLQATGTSTLSSLTLVAGREGDGNPLTQSLSSAVSGISDLSVHAQVSGTLEQYDVKIRSDLDRILQDAAGKMVKDLGARFGKELQAAISAKVSGPLKGLNGEFGGLNGIGGEFTKRLTQENGLLQGLVEKTLPQKGILKKTLPGGFKLPF